MLIVNEKIIETITIEGVDFTVIEKAKTIYAGFHSVAPDFENEPDSGDTHNRFQKEHTKIIDSVTSECMICLSIGYNEWNWREKHDVIREVFHGKETGNINQPEGIRVIEALPRLLIRVKSTDAAWALTKKTIGADKPEWHMAPLFTLIEALFCTPERGFKAGSDENLEIEYYNFDGTQYAAIPVRKI